MKRFKELVVAVTLVLSPAGVCADGSSLEVDLETGKPSIENPTVNLWSNDTILVRLTNVDSVIARLKVDEVVAFLDLPRWSQDSQSALSDGTFTVGRTLSIRFFRCKAEQAKPLIDRVKTYQNEQWLTRAKASVGLRRAGTPIPTIEDAPRPIDCGFAVHDAHAPSWTVVTDDASVSVVVAGATRDKARSMWVVKDGAIAATMLQAVRKPFRLEWSAGFGLAKVDHRRYRFEPIEENDELKSVLLAPEKEYQYQLVAMAHYMSLQSRGQLGISTGVAVDVPLESLTISFGGTVALRTLPLPANTNAYLTFGIAYTPSDRRKPDFEGQTRVATNINAESLLEGRYGFVPFLGLTFGFMGGESEFTGVFKGRKQKPD